MNLFSQSFRMKARNTDPYSAGRIQQWNSVPIGGLRNLNLCDMFKSASELCVWALSSDCGGLSSGKSLSGFQCVSTFWRCEDSLLNWVQFSFWSLHYGRLNSSRPLVLIFLIPAKYPLSCLRELSSLHRWKTFNANPNLDSAKCGDHVCRFSRKIERSFPAEWIILKLLS